MGFELPDPNSISGVMCLQFAGFSDHLGILGHGPSCHMVLLMFCDYSPFLISSFILLNFPVLRRCCLAFCSGNTYIFTSFYTENNENERTGTRLKSVPLSPVQKTHRPLNTRRRRIDRQRSANHPEYQLYYIL